MTITSLGAVFLGGALGGLARAWLATRLTGAGGLLAVNTSGSFALGWLAATVAPESAVWLFWATGVLGAYTTVSSFALQSVQMWLEGARGRASANVIAAVVLSVAAVALGYGLGAMP
ncbi:fluoride efflux transporter FluC [Roseibaca sp. Y0-43]|uniref:fluoride efflux transporter FluC n=1 Tax=Roseibaca sp. Y0-43 TaxID=2816854 RepID=UPI001D0C5F68|nr:CrcB family protein [Roseibaca sp. Y0-43]